MHLSGLLIVLCSRLIHFINKRAVAVPGLYEFANLFFWIGFGPFLCLNRYCIRPFYQGA